MTGSISNLFPSSGHWSISLVNNVKSETWNESKNTLLLDPTLSLRYCSTKPRNVSFSAGDDEVDSLFAQNHFYCWADFLMA